MAPVGHEMSGLGIRCIEIARALTVVADMTVAAPESESCEDGAIRIASFRPHAPAALKQLILDADFIIAQPQWPIVNRWLAQSPATVIFDLYTPETLETIESTRTHSPRSRRLSVDATIDRLIGALHTGDHFICASERQRDLWLGTMIGTGTLRIGTYDADSSLRNVIDVVPFGVPETVADPVSTNANPIRDTFPVIGEDDPIVLWNGGVWPWLDAQSAIHAMPPLLEKHPGARLVFMGASDNPIAREATGAAVAAARACGLLDSHVLFNDRWIPYEQRFSWLRVADCGLSLHHDHLETRFAFRTRLLDCLWARLPIVCSEGDVFAEAIARDDLGMVADDNGPRAVSECLASVLGRGKNDFSPALTRAAEAHLWSSVVKPIRKWVTQMPDAPVSADPWTGTRRSRAMAYRASHRLLDRRRAT